jgi:hypothetical protein
MKGVKTNTEQRSRQSKQYRNSSNRNTRVIPPHQFYCSLCQHFVILSYVLIFYFSSLSSLIFFRIFLFFHSLCHSLHYYKLIRYYFNLFIFFFHYWGLLILSSYLPRLYSLQFFSFISRILHVTYKKTNSVALSPQTNYTD